MQDIDVALSAVLTKLTEERNEVHTSKNKLPFIPGCTRTLMVRNIPLRFTPESFREIIDSRFRGLYDYCYFPVDFRSKRGLGYCFLSFVESASAEEFVRLFDNKVLANTNSKKLLSISAAVNQGMMENVASLKLATLQQMPGEDLLPVVRLLGRLFPLTEGLYRIMMDQDFSADSPPTKVLIGDLSPNQK